MSVGKRFFRAAGGVHFLPSRCSTRWSVKKYLSNQTPTLRSAKVLRINGFQHEKKKQIQSVAGVSCAYKSAFVSRTLTTRRREVFRFVSVHGDKYHRPTQNDSERSSGRGFYRRHFPPGSGSARFSGRSDWKYPKQLTCDYYVRENFNSYKWRLSADLTTKFITDQYDFISKRISRLSVDNFLSTRNVAPTINFCDCSLKNGENTSGNRFVLHLILLLRSS